MALQKEPETVSVMVHEIPLGVILSFSMRSHGEYTLEGSRGQNTTVTIPVPTRLNSSRDIVLGSSHKNLIKHATA